MTDLRSDGWDLVPERPFKRTRTRSKNEHVGCSNDVDEDDKQAKVAWSKKLPEESVDETEPEPISEVSKAGNVRVDYKELDQTDISPDQSLQRKIWDEFWTSCSLDVNMPDIAEDAAKTEMHTGICSDNSSEDLDKMDWVAFRTDKIVYRPSGTAIDYVGAHIPRAPEDLTLGIDALSQEVTAADLDLVSKDSDNNLSGSSALSVSIDAIKATRYEQTQLRAWGGSAKVFIDSGSNNRSGSILVKDTAAITWDDSSDEGSFGEDKDSASDRSSETSASLGKTQVKYFAEVTTYFMVVIDVGALTGAGHHVKANAEDGDGASVVQGGLLQGSSSSSPPSIASVEMDDIDEEIREDGSEVE